MTALAKKRAVGSVSRVGGPPGNRFLSAPKLRLWHFDCQYSHRLRS